MFGVVMSTFAATEFPRVHKIAMRPLTLLNPLFVLPASELMYIHEEQEDGVPDGLSKKQWPENSENFPELVLGTGGKEEERENYKPI